MRNTYTDPSEYAISTWMLEAFDLRTALSMIARKGFQTVELWGNATHLDPRVRPPIAEVRFWMKQYGLTAHSVHAPFRHHLFPHPADAAEFRAYRMEMMRQTIEACAELGAPILVVHPLDRREYNHAPSEVGEVADFLHALCQYAGPLGVTIAVENLIGSSDAKGNDDELECTLENLVRLFSNTGVKYCLDIGHAILNACDPRREVDAAGSSLVTFHVHNTDGVRDNHALPSEGIIDWPALRQYIRSAGYQGPFVMEVAGGPNPAETLRRVVKLFAPR